MVALPPGTLLQLMYLRERLGRRRPGRFVEVGPGAGEITAVLLGLGWSGTSFDLSETTVRQLETRFSGPVSMGALRIVAGDFLASVPPKEPDERVDLIISSMVMEHLDEDGERCFMVRSAEWLRADGGMIGLVPASDRYWGIEDEIAGHYRRYTRERLGILCQRTGWECGHRAGLTYPVSNLLLPLSNWLVRRHESGRLGLTAEERTRKSGDRHVPFKTRFPGFLGWILNGVVMMPLFWLQKCFLGSDRAMVIYFEARRRVREPGDEQSTSRTC